MAESPDSLGATPEHAASPALRYYKALETARFFWLDMLERGRRLLYLAETSAWW